MYVDVPVSHTPQSRWVNLLKQHIESGEFLIPTGTYVYTTAIAKLGTAVVFHLCPQFVAKCIFTHMLVWFLVGEARPRLTKNLSEFKVFWLVFLRKDYLDDSTPCSSLVWLLRVFSSYLLSHRSSFLSQVHLSPDNNMAATPQVLVPLMFPQSVYHVAIPFSALWLNLKAETTKKNQLSEIKYGRSKAES